MIFTQFMFPNGLRRQQIIDMEPAIEHMARKLNEDGCVFEIECFPDTQMVNMDCTDPGEETLAVEVCTNGPDVPERVEKLVARAFETKYGYIVE